MAAELPLAVFVIVKDEQERIERCLASVAWIPQRIVVVDAATRDATAERARPHATDLFVRPWEGFVAARRFALSHARHPWVLWIDADEIVTPALAASIRTAVAAPGGRDGYRVRRRNRYMGRAIHHGAWGNDRVVRLFRRDRSAFPDRLVHEQVAVDGPIGELDGELEHESCRDLAHHLQKIALWSDLWARQAIADGRRLTWLDLALRPPARFVKGYLLRAGFLDGRAGLVLAYMDAFYAGCKVARALEIGGARPGSGRKEEEER